MIRLTDILIESLLEQKKDRCHRIADRRYDKPSAYKSGATASLTAIKSVPLSSIGCVCITNPTAICSKLM